MTLLEKYEVRLQQIYNGSKEIYEGERANIEVILRLGWEYTLLVSYG